MYLDHFGLREAPFAITPDPRFVFLSERHREALAHLRYGIAQGGSGGFVLLTGDIGTGKTTLSRLLLEQLPPGTQPALLLNPKVTALELLESLCDELGIAPDRPTTASSKPLVDALNAHLLAVHARGGQVVALIDEAQNLSSEALEQVRLLTNLETPAAKLLQVILLGQPELRDVLARPDLAQLAQRITARYHLTPLDPHETETYLRHRLAVAGSKRFPFSASAVRALHARAGGVPRRLNIVADRALTGAYAEQVNEIGVDLVQRAANEAMGESRPRGLPKWTLAFGALALVTLLLLASTTSRDSQPAGGAVDATRLIDAAAVPSATASAAHASPTSAQPHIARAAQDLPVRDDVAWRRLLDAWHVAVAPLPRDCLPELAPGVYCLESVGSLERLRRLGAPALVALETDGGIHRLLLLHITDEQLGLASERGVVAMSRKAFEASWLGEFRAVWRAPVNLPAALTRGAGVASVQWLERGLEAAGLSLDSSHVGGRYDAAVVNAVRTLQRRFGLREDGIAGRETQWILGSRLASASGEFAHLPQSGAVSPSPHLDSIPSSPR